MNDLVSIQFGDTQRTALILPDGLTIQEWKQIGHKLLNCRESLWFWIGDWINYGEAKYGDKYSEAKKVFGEESTIYGGYDEGSLRRAASIAARVPVALRNNNLTFTHHAVVAALDKNDQKKWLKEAEEKRLTVRDLTAAIRGNLQAKSTLGVNTTADVFIFDRWINEAVRGFKGFPIVQWPDAELLMRIRKISEIERPLLEEAKGRGLEVS